MFLTNMCQDRIYTIGFSCLYYKEKLFLQSENKMTDGQIALILIMIL